MLWILLVSKTCAVEDNSSSDGSELDPYVSRVDGQFFDGHKVPERGMNGFKLESPKNKGVEDAHLQKSKLVAKTSSRSIAESKHGGGVRIELDFAAVVLDKPALRPKAIVVMQIPFARPILAIGSACFTSLELRYRQGR